MKRRATLIAAAAVSLVCGCDGGYDPPEHAEPSDSIAPVPDAPVVPGAEEPGSQPGP